VTGDRLELNALSHVANALLQGTLWSQELILKKGARQLNIVFPTAQLAERAAGSWKFTEPLNHLCLLGRVQERGRNNCTCPLTKAIKALEPLALLAPIRQQARGSCGEPLR
jgi:hypothetical protein